MPAKKSGPTRPKEKKPEGDLTLVFTMAATKTRDSYELRFTPADVTRAMKITLDKDMGRTFGECLARVGDMLTQGISPDSLYVAPLLWGAKVQTEDYRGSIESVDDECEQIVGLAWENLPDGSPEASGGSSPEKA